MWDAVPAMPGHTVAVPPAESRLAPLPQTLLEQLARMPDPRIDRTKRHLLVDILAIAMIASVAGADDYVAMAAFGVAHQAWFQTFLALPNGIPSHDTFTRVLARLKPQALEQLLVQWSATIARLVQGTVVAIDGKTARHSYRDGDPTTAVHTVSAWSTTDQVVLGQVKTQATSNEITAIPALLALLALRGCTVTIDAMGCQQAIATAIRQQRAHYVLSVKQNQPWLHERLAAVFAHPATDTGYWGRTPHARYTTTEKDHGRLEVRTYTLVPAAAVLYDRTGWADLTGIGCVHSHRTLGAGPKRGATTQETRYFITSLPAHGAPAVAAFAHAVRSHWCIENQCHWTLDVVFQEDQNRTRTGQGATNLAVLRKWGLSVLRRDKAYDQQHAPTKRYGLKTRRLLAGWDLHYLIRVLGFAAPEATPDAPGPSPQATPP